MSERESEREGKRERESESGREGEGEGGRERCEASAILAESSSLGLSRVRAGRCTYASGKVAIKILRKRYHAACRAGTAFILAHGVHTVQLCRAS